jgi:hypothetical protein
LIDTTHLHRKERRLVTECTSQAAYLLVAGVDVYDIEHSFGQATYCVYSNIIILLKQAGGDNYLVCK